MRGKHWYYFGEESVSKFQNLSNNSNSLNQETWDILRIDDVSSPFAIENTKKEYESNCLSKTDYIEAAELIGKELNEVGGGINIVSLGIGKGILEWNMKRIFPSFKIDCLDYTEKALEKLRKVWNSPDEFYTFDMIKGDWAKLKTYDYVLMYRLSTEFDFKTWRDIFYNMYLAGITKVIYVPTGFDNLKIMMREKLIHFKHKIRGREDTFCGWLYTANEFYKMWDQYYIVEKEIKIEENNKIFFLHIKN